MLLLSRLRLAGSCLRELGLAGLCLAGSLSASFVGAAYAQTSNSTTVAGSLEGEFAVDDSGAATYSLPISVPPGIAGNEPRLALSYSSQAGNGPLGVGWGLSGLSAITRCGQRLVPHGKIHGVDFSAADRFCLDGQRLVAVSGDYGADGTEYRTEIESYAKVISNGTAGTGPASFTVWSKGGLVLEYGVTDDSRIEAIKADGTARSEARIWALNKQFDRSDNAITYDYTEDQTNGSYRINRIDYGGNATAGTTATSSVRFVYENRTDIRTWYQAGAQIIQDKRLKNIQTYEAETLVADYEAGYEYNGLENRSRITQLLMCEAGGSCLKPISITWNEDSASWPEMASLGDFGETDYEDRNSYPLVYGDWNGDGVSDIGRVTSSGMKFYVANRFAFEDKVHSFFENYTQLSELGQSTLSDSNLYPVVSGDWDGNGLTDIARVTDNGMTFLVSTGTSFETYAQFNDFGQERYDDGNTYPVLTGDWNGDGRTDIGRVTSTGIKFYTSQGNYFNAFTSLTSLGQSSYANASHYPLITGDWNGDGRTDIGRVTTSGIEFFTSSGNRFDAFTFLSALGKSSYSDDPTYPLITGDWNGDGLTDLGRVTSTGMTFFVSSGTKFVSYAGLNDLGQNSYSLQSNYPLVQGDWNNDGLSDIGRISDTGIKLYVSNGQDWVHFKDVESFGKNSYADSNLYPVTTGDWNGDGSPDIARVVSGGVDFLFSDYQNSNKAKAFTSSRGHKTSVRYKPLIKTPVSGEIFYKAGNAASYPEQTFMGTMYAVSSVEREDGVTGLRHVDYAYADGRVDVERGSFLGFGQIVSSDRQRGTQTLTDYHQDWPFTRRTKKTTRQILDGTPIEIQERSWEQVVTTGQAVGVRLSKTVHQQFDDPAFAKSTGIPDGSSGSSPEGEQFYSSAGSYDWIVPAGVTTVRVSVVGAGGSGGQNGTWTGSGIPGNLVPGTRGGGGGGGGSGALAQKIISVTPGETISVSVGTGGAAPVYTHPTYGPNATGLVGEQSSFGNVITAAPGQGGVGGSSQHLSTGEGGAGGVGGVATFGDFFSVSGKNGLIGAHRTTVSGTYLYAAGGAGGTGFNMRNVACGAGGPGPEKISGAGQLPSNPGVDGCVLIEWGASIQEAENGPTQLLYSQAGNYNWTVPAGVTTARVTLVGGGGSGGQKGTWTSGNGSPSSRGGGGGGGGAGALTQKLIPVTPGDVLPIVIGAGGDVPVYTHPTYGPNATGLVGEESSFSDVLTAAPGQGGGGGYSQHLSTGAGGAGGAGGVAVGGELSNVDGQSGLAGDPFSTVGGRYLYGAGGVGGAGHMLAGTSCGVGGAGPGKVPNAGELQSNPGGAGCALIEWGASLEEPSDGPNNEFFSSAGSHNWVVPAGVTAVRVSVIGGGGSAGAMGTWTTGSNADGNQISSRGGGGGGGGAGAYVQKILTVTPGDTIPVTVGAGGTASIYAHPVYGKNTDGKVGVQSSFGTLLTAAPGQGGGGAYHSGPGGTGGPGGSALGGTLLNLSGQDGQTGDPYSTAGSTNVHANGGPGGNGYFLEGTNCGAGGSGHSKENNADNTDPGSPGCVLIEWGPEILEPVNDGSGSEFYRSSGVLDWTVPNDVTAVRVTLVGAGGSGGQNGTWFGSGSFIPGGGGGGGGAGAVVQKILAVSSGDVIPVTIGAGAEASIYAHPVVGKNTDGTSGQQSTFGSLLNAAPGMGGGGGYSQHQSSGAAGVAGAGAVASGGDLLNINGQDGTVGDPSSTAGGTYLYGNGGNGGEGYLLEGTSCGSGGAGPAKKARHGQNPSLPGSDGCVLIEWGPDITASGSGGSS
ncbi:glycine-rich domain-containing protein [Kiloniella majae]|uniref:glycine-rich domain-containing protein n=2 Tax=Kiloniella majae TaxID=1938558 RepID=UPI000A2788B5|nr:SpvB/TcaC N-terminal domain-containing protein [Kiloniella majae]